MTKNSTKNYLEIAKNVFRIESSAIEGLVDRLDEGFINSVEHILSTKKGRVIVCGMGKSGIIGKKIVATLASTGTQSFFMHPGEAYHGDLGMVSSNDIFIAISNSGETDEVIKLIPFLKDNNNYLIAMTGNRHSTLAQAANCHIDVGVSEEACPLKLAPTASTTATLAMGDALAVTLMKARNFQPEHFARFHPGGSLGRRLLARVEDEMVKENLPFIGKNTIFLDIIHVMSKGKKGIMGLAIINDLSDAAIITDGDLRRAMEKYGNKVFDKKADELMTRNPASVSVGTRVEDALALMQARKITSLLVTDKNDVVGVFKK